MISATHLRLLSDLIKRRCGLLFEGHGEDSLRNAVARRMGQSKIANPVTYLARLAKDEEEFQHLVTLLTINETYFFREEDQLTLAINKLIPRLLAQRKDNTPLRILSAGCSSGEEPYSIAIALFETYGETMRSLFHIAACDIDRQALARAKTARYSPFSFRGVAPERRDRYFQASDRRFYTLSDKLRSLVHFHHINLLAPDFPAEMQSFDIVFFRNVSIYFDQPTRHTILINLGGLMKSFGYLFVGNAETMANDLGVFPMVREDGLFYFTKGFSTSAINQPKKIPVAPRPPLAIPSPVRCLVPQKVVHIENTQLLEAWARIQANDFNGAAQLAVEVLKRDEWSLDACVLAGLAAKWNGDAALAIHWLKRAVYARNECWVAHYYLADLLRAAGNDVAAQRSYRLALHQLSKPVPLLDGGLSIPMCLPIADIRFLCERFALPTEPSRIMMDARL